MNAEEGSPERERNLLDLPVDAMLDELGAPEGSFGSGAAAALVAAVAAEVVAGAARRSGEWEHARGAAAQAHALRLRAAPLAASDARAYAEARLLLRARSAEGATERDDFRLGQALALAAEVPLLIAAAAADVAALAKEVAEQAAPDVRIDAAGAAVLAEAAARAAAHLVEINLGMTSSDPRVASARSIVAEAAAAAEHALALD